MSRTRIVKGKITEIIGGDYNIFSESSIIDNAAGLIAEKGESKGVSYSSPVSAPPSPVSAKCLIFFRPNTKWRGEFGFDWVRVNDTKLEVDYPYNGIIGSYGSIYGSQPGAVFTPSNSDYQTILKQYNSFGTYKGRYYVPNMTLKSGETAILDAIVHVEERAESLHYAYNEDVFELTILKQFTVATGVNHDENSLRIRCKRPFSATETIRVIATKNRYMTKVGEIKILPNNNIVQKNIIMIPVKINKMNSTGGVKSNEINFTNSAMKQSYASSHITQAANAIEMDGVFFNWFFTTRDRNGNIVMNLSRWRSLHSALESEFFDDPTNKIYRNHYRVYLLPTSLNLNGVAEGIGNTKVVVAFANRNDESTAHELLHAMGLHHTFDNSSQFTFKFKKTDNIMDYTHHDGKKRFSTNKFQWRIINPNIR